MCLKALESLKHKDFCHRKNGAPGGTRTHDPQIRNLVLYPAELRALGPTLYHPAGLWERLGRSRGAGAVQRPGGPNGME